VSERVVHFRPRSVLVALGVVLGVATVVGFVVLARAGLTLIAISLFLALALNPAVEFFEGRGMRRGAAVGTVYLIAVGVIALLALVFVPPLVDQIGNFIDATPRLVADLTHGNGPLGFLETKYHVVEHVRKATSGSGDGLSAASEPALSVVKGVASTLLGVVIIAFLTLFMLLEGPEWRVRLTELIPQSNRESVERVGAGVYRSVGGFVTGNLLASILAGIVATVIMLAAGVPYAIPIGLFVAIIELVPYIGPAIATVLVVGVALTKSPLTAVVVGGLLIVYHAIEGHSLRPMIYGRALQLSPLAVLIAILLGTEIAGILGALAAIPVAGSIQVIAGEVMERRRQRPVQAS
jgi:predicted PurR-regulated permease PerM